MPPFPNGADIAWISAAKRMLFLTVRLCVLSMGAKLKSPLSPQGSDLVAAFLPG
jgi:hypothetical protein